MQKYLVMYSEATRKSVVISCHPSVSAGLPVPCWVYSDFQEAYNYALFLAGYQKGNVDLRIGYTKEETAILEYFDMRLEERSDERF